VIHHFKRLFAHSVVYGLAETISRGTGFILVFIYARALSPEELGVRTLVYSAAAFLGLFYTIGLDNAFLRYFMDREYGERKDEVLSTAFSFTTAIGLAFLAAALVFDGFFSRVIAGDPSYRSLIRLLFLILVLDTVVVYPTLVLRAENRMRYYSLVALVRFVLFIALNLLFVVAMKRGLDGVFEANLIVVAVIAVMLVPVYKTYLRRHLSSAVLARMLRFGVPTIFTLLAMRIVDYSDRFLIRYLLPDGDRQNGFYTVAYSLGMVGILVFVNSFRLAWQPFFLSVKENPDARTIFSRVATYYAMFIGMVFLGMTLFRAELFHLYTPSYPVVLANLIPFVAMAYVLDGFYLIMIAGVFIREKTIYLPIATAAGAVINFGLNFLAIPALGILGAALSTIAAYVAMVAVLYFVSKRVYRVDYEFGRIGVVFGVTALAALLPEFVAPGGYLAGFVMRAALLFLPPIVYLFSGFLRPEEYQALRRFNLKALSGLGPRA
jgi:O-antigen/teichoic acid export membrane protein